MSGNYEDEPPHLFATASDGEALVKTQCQELRRDAAVLFILPVACVCSPTTFQSPLDVPLHRCIGTRYSLPCQPILDWAWQTHVAVHTSFGWCTLWRFQCAFYGKYTQMLTNSRLTLQILSLIEIKVVPLQQKAAKLLMLGN